ncbi:NUDIX hydrolase [Gracilimonas mengyeensis]|uniref:8-oxo-dGTP pyrophosphatase MutT, NUDIX family n=1 Tax=Gracilimonas mengyeensis TaxID=1302730 RepID=A0A521B718_9BACT|nr:NUDIX hydrolase [Gracilimonas mengyeensis]SMO42888.1 8-oxo-dGTP pyrophosphatase MutT, NUDIX family [Gracilimonas mengyeensis]
MPDQTDIQPVEAAGGVVFRQVTDTRDPHVLMIFRNGVWDLPKGKLEPSESVAQCAVREVAEEVGCALPCIVAKTGTTYHEYSEKGNQIGKTTHWFTMILTGQNTSFEPQENEGITKVQWVPLSEAIEKAGFKNLKEILITFREQIVK